MSKKTENTAFTCANCHKDVPPADNGGYRNHCPFCLYSLHVDITPGDRRSPCGGLMPPAGMVYSGRKGWQIVHKCEKCGFERKNEVCVGDVCPDDWDKVIALSARGTKNNS